MVANLQGEQSFTNGQPFPLHTVLSLNNKAFFQDDRKFIMARPPSKDFLKVRRISSRPSILRRFSHSLYFLFENRFQVISKSLQNQQAYVYFDNISPTFAPGSVGEVEIVLKTPPKSMALYLVEVRSPNQSTHRFSLDALNATDRFSRSSRLRFSND